MAQVPTDRSASLLTALRGAPAGLSRTELAGALGIARATLTETLTDLLDEGLIVEDEATSSTGGRPPQTYRLNANAAYIGVIDVGGSRSRVGVANLAGQLLDDAVLTINVETGPEPIMEWAVSEMERMLKAHTRKGSAAPRTAIVVGLPGPVDFTTGRVVSPPIMGSWQDFDVRTYIAARIDAPIIIDNDVNLIGLAEQRLSHPDSRVLMVIKLGTGVGGGLVIDGQVLRGARGAAGDIGHIQSTRAHGALCRCGHTGCVEAIAGGWALVQELTERGLDVTNVSDVAQLVRDGDPIATSHVRAAAKAIALAAAQAVSLLNPDTLVIAGEMLGAGDAVLAQVREGIYQYSLPLATHDLVLVPSTLGPLVGLKGGAELGIDYLLGTVTIPQLTKAAA
ncbi:MAG: hypothetical protein RJB01_1709 [Actinomycetota bacterium]|jgi:predicted NBD/HSP70 family sugar kinase